MTSEKTIDDNDTENELAEQPVEETETKEENIEQDKDWDEIGYIISSRYRVEALDRLSQSPAPPSQIAEDKDVGIAHVSRALQDLKEKGLVDLLVSNERKKGRVYGLTERGQEIWEKIQSEQIAMK